MSDAPERIWADRNAEGTEGSWTLCHEWDGDVEYTRTDLIQPMIDKAVEDAKEAEAYAEELEKELDTCRRAQAVMDNTVADLEAKLTKAVEVLEFYADESAYETQYERLPCDCCTDIYEPINRDKGQNARATLARIKNGKPMTDYEAKVAQMKEDFPNGI